MKKVAKTTFLKGLKTLTIIGLFGLVLTPSFMAQAQSASPTITFYATPTSVDSGGSSTLTWSSPSAWHCNASGDWSGEKSLSGTESTGTLTSTKTYNINCFNGAGSNNASITVTVNNQVATFPDLVASAPTPAAVTANVPQVFSSTISNIGNMTTEIGFANLFQTATGPNGTGTITNQTFIFSTMNPLAAGASAVTTSIPNTVIFTSPGLYSARVCADGNINAIVESNENNNCSPWTNVTVTDPTATTMPDLKAYAPGPFSATTNVPIAFLSYIENAGNVSTNASFPNFFQTATLANGGGTISDQSYVMMGALAKNSTIYSTSPLITFPHAGTYSVRACADKYSSTSNGVIAESNENNNCGPWSNVTVTDTVATASPDLVASAPTPAAVTANVPQVFSSTISNIGNAPTDTSFTNKFQTATAPNGGGVISEIQFSQIYSRVNSLVAGASATVNSTPNIVVFSSPGAYSIRTCADSIQSIIESNENNNCSPWTNVTVTNPVVVQNPTASISAHSMSIPYGLNTNLSWYSTNATSCVGTNFNTSGLTSGAVSSGTLYQTTTFSVTCYGASGTTPATDQVTVTVNPQIAQNPTVQLTAVPASIHTNESTTLYWSSNNATTCNTSWGGGAGAVSGSTVIYPPSTTTYSITCYGGAGTTPATASATVTVTPLAIVSGNLYVSPSACTITAGNSTCTSGATWNTSNATSPAVVDRNTNTVLSTSANNYNPLTVWVAYPNTTFDLKNGLTTLDTKVVTASCASGSTWNGNKCAINTVTPIVNINANPLSVQYNGTSVVTWNSTNAQTCNATGGNSGWSGARALSGSFYTGALTNTTTYNITCTSSTGQTASDSVTVNVGNQLIPTGNLTVSPASCLISAGASTCTTGATWNTTNVTSATLVDRNTGATLASAINRSSPLTVWVAYPSTTFDLKNNGTTILDTQVAYASCVSGTSWSNGSCMTNAVTPTVNLVANPTSILSGQTSILSWSSANAVSCASTNFNAGNATGGTRAVSPALTTNYSITCTSSTGQSATASTTVYVSSNPTCQDPAATNYGGPLPCTYYFPPQNPSVNLTANPTSILYGGSSTLSWNTNSNTTSCSANWTTSTATTGSKTVTPATTTTYSITCYGASGTTPATDQVTVNVGSQPIPSGDLTVSPSSCVINAGQSTCTTGATWNTTNVTSATLVDRNTGATLASAINRSSPLTVWVAYPSTTFDLKNNGTSILDTEVATASCASGSSWNGSTCLTNQIATPTVSLTANPSNIQSGNSSSLTWTSQNATSCYAPWTSSSANAGSASVSPTMTTTYSITCINSTGLQATANATVSVNQQTQSPTVNLYADNNNVNSGNSTTLRWNSTNATSCYGSNFNTNNSTSGNTQTSSLYNTTTYSITCTGSTGQQASASTTIYVNNNNQTCQDPNASNYGGQLPCNYYNSNICQDPSALNYRGTLPCRYYVAPQVCQDPSALNYRGVLPCIYQQINNQPTVVLDSDSKNLAYNSSTNIRWYTSNATSCYASGGSIGWAGVKSIGPASFYTGSLTGTRTYTLTCTNNYGTTSDSITVNVRGQVINPVTPVAPTSLVLITSTVDRNQPIVPTIDNTRPHPGDQINYTVSYQNIGNASITGLTLRIDLPYEVDYLFSNPNNPTRNGNTLIFNLGTLRANGQGTVTVRVRVRDDIPAGTNLNFPAVLSYIDPSGYPQSVTANVSAQVWTEPVVTPLAPTDVNNNVNLGANVFGAGFFPGNLFGWLLLLILILILILLAKYLFDKAGQPFTKKTTTTTIKNV